MSAPAHNETQICGEHLGVVVKGKRLSPLCMLHEQPSSALSAATLTGLARLPAAGPRRYAAAPSSRAAWWCADGARILVCHHLPSASPPLPQIHEGSSGARAAATEGPNFLPLPKSLPDPLPVHQFAFASPSYQDQGVCPWSAPPDPALFLLGFLFPQVCSFSALHPAVSETNQNTSFHPEYHPHLF